MYKYIGALSNPFIVSEHAYQAYVNTEGRGAAIECGSYAGCTANVLSYMMMTCGIYQALYAADTFAGFPYTGAEQTKYAKGDLKPPSPVVVQELRRRGITVLPGKVEDTLPTIAYERFAFAYLDLDLELPTRFCWDFLSQRLLPGGRIGFHDYDESPKYALPGIVKVVRGILESGDWKEVYRRKGGADRRVIFLERV